MDPLYTLPELPYLRLSFTLRALEPAGLPPYHGSLLRGAFGHALRGAVCAMGPGAACSSCRLLSVCPYPRLFETPFDGAPPPFLRGLATAPRPYVFEPGLWRERWAPGETLPFDLLLFGRAAELWPYAVLAVERMAAAGLGARRHRFALERVEAPEAQEGSRRLTEGGRATGAPPPLPRPAPAWALGGERAVLSLLTPLRIVSRGRLVRELTFRTLVFAMLRRVLELASCHAPAAAVDWRFQPLLERAAAVEIVRAELAWQDLTRYSQRQERKVEMGGLVGTLELAGDLAPFAPLLGAARVTHVGKGTTLGLGRLGRGGPESAAAPPPTADTEVGRYGWRA